MSEIYDFFSEKQTNYEQANNISLKKEVITVICFKHFLNEVVNIKVVKVIAKPGVGNHFSDSEMPTHLPSSSHHKNQFTNSVVHVSSLCVL